MITKAAFMHKNPNGKMAENSHKILTKNQLKDINLKKTTGTITLII